MLVNRPRESALANKNIYLTFLSIFGDVPAEAYAKFIHDITVAIQAFNAERHAQYVQGKRGIYTYTPQPFQSNADYRGEQFKFEVVYPLGFTENQEDAGIDFSAVDIDIRLDSQGVDRLQFMFEGEWKIACKDDQRKSIYLSLNQFLGNMNRVSGMGRKRRHRTTRRTRGRRATLKSRFVR